MTLALAYDIDSIQRKGKRLGANWQTRFPDNSAPYTSTIVFLVRKGNPKQIHDWPDLIKRRRRGRHAESEDLGRRALELSRRVGLRAARRAARRLVEARRSGRGEARGGGAGSSREVRRPSCIKHVPVLDSGARGATNTFVQREIGDVLLAWENEALLAITRARARQGRDRRAVGQHPRRAAGRGRRHRRRSARHAPDRRSLSAVSVHAEPARRSRRNITSGRAMPQVLETYQRAVPAAASCSRSTRCSAAGQQAHEKHFADGGVFDQIYGARSQ